MLTQHPPCLRQPAVGSAGAANTVRPTPRAEHRGPNTKGRTPRAEHHGPNTTGRTPRAEHRGPNTKGRTPRAEHHGPPSYHGTGHSALPDRAGVTEGQRSAGPGGGNGRAVQTALDSGSGEVLETGGGMCWQSEEFS